VPQAPTRRDQRPNAPSAPLARTAPRLPVAPRVAAPESIVWLAPQAAQAAPQVTIAPKGSTRHHHVPLAPTQRPTRTAVRAVWPGRCAPRPRVALSPSTRPVEADIQRLALSSRWLALQARLAPRRRTLPAVRGVSTERTEQPAANRWPTDTSSPTSKQNLPVAPMVITRKAVQLASSAPSATPALVGITTVLATPVHNSAWLDPQALTHAPTTWTAQRRRRAAVCAVPASTVLLGAPAHSAQVPATAAQRTANRSSPMDTILQQEISNSTFVQQAMTAPPVTPPSQ